MDQFGMASIIDQLTKLQKSHSLRPIEEQEDQKSFTFQQLPRESDRIKISKYAYLNNDSCLPLERVEEKGSAGLQREQIHLREIGQLDFFEDIEDFHSRKEEISKIQKKYLSVVSNDSQHKRAKKKIFSDKQNQVSVSTNNHDHQKEEQKLEHSQNWLAKKGDSIKSLLGEIHLAMAQCYANVPDKQTVLNKFDSIAQRRY